MERVENVLDHDERAVHDDAEVERAEAQKVRDMPVKCMQMKANSSDSGMVRAVRSAARRLKRTGAGV